MLKKHELEKAIRKIYPDIDKYGLKLSIRKDRLIASDKYIATLCKDRREVRFKLDRADVEICVDGNQCRIINEKLTGFMRQFIDENYALAESG